MAPQNITNYNTVQTQCNTPVLITVASIHSAYYWSLTVVWHQKKLLLKPETWDQSPLVNYNKTCY